MRYVGQAHEVTIEVPMEEVAGGLIMESIKKLENIFHESHKSLFGHASMDAAVEFITISVSAVGLIDKGQMRE